MANRSLKYSTYCNQVIFSKDKGNTMQMDLIYFTDEIIREYGKAADNTFYLFAKDLPPDIQKMFLIHLVPIEDYEYYIERPSLLKEIIEENLIDMQNIIDDRCDEVYRQDMEDMGRHLKHFPDNNEVYY